MDIDEVPNASTADETPDESRVHEDIPVDLRKRAKPESEHEQDEPLSPAKENALVLHQSTNMLGRPKGATPLARMGDN